MTEQVYKINFEAYQEYLCMEEKSLLTIEKYTRDAKKFLLFAEERKITKELVCCYKAHLTAAKGKTYYYKVRAYKTVNGKKVYGPWSSVKQFKRK